MMINKILQDIDNVIIEIEEEKDHDKIVEEVVRRLVENDLYMKPKNISGRYIKLADSKRS